jgi:hypothetical protein
MRRLVLAVILVLAATVLFAAARQDTKSSPPMMPGMMHGMMGNVMPMNFPGVEFAVADVPDGVNVTITTKTGDVTELRRFVRARVEMMQAMHAGMATAKPNGK